MKWQAIAGCGLLCSLLAAGTTAHADTPTTAPSAAATGAAATGAAATGAAAPGAATADAATTGAATTADAPAGKEGQEGEVKAALQPLAQRIAAARSGRATVELTMRSMIAEEVISSEKTVFQIASQQPNRYRVQLKGDHQRIDILSDGKQASVLIGNDAYYQQPAPDALQEAVIALPAPLGPYPEPMMALSLAGVDLAPSLLHGMERLEVANRDPYDGQPAVQLQGTQADGVTWVLWVTADPAKPQPLRMKVDLTPVLASGDENALPDNFALELDYKFTRWDMDAELQAALFEFKPPADAKQYASLEEYAQTLRAAASTHPLLGIAAPPTQAKLLDGTDWDLSQQRGKVVVLDFWATWCGPCIDAMPVIVEATAALADREVVFYAINIGESPEQIEPFLERLGVDVKVVLDPEGKLAQAYAAEAIPQTVLIGKDGRIEAVHVGFSTLEGLKQQLSEQLGVLAAGGRLQAEEAAADEAAED